MKNFFLYCIAFSPAFVYMAYEFLTKKPNTGIDFTQSFVAAILCGAGYSLATYLRKKNT